MTEETMQDPKSVTALYWDGARVVEAAIAGLSEAELDCAPDAENWSIRQIIHHLADGDDIWSLAVKMALCAGDAEFDLRWYLRETQIQWSRNWAYTRRDTGPALALLAASRRYIIDLVEAVPGAWERKVTIQWSQQEAEQATVGEILAMQARHVCGHIEEIQKIRQSHGI